MPKLSKIDKLILKAGKKIKGTKKWIRYCPECRSTDVALRAHMEAVWYYCRKCNYHSASFPEKSGK